MQLRDEPAGLGRQPAATVALCAFVDREREARRLEEAILKRESLIVCGPPGIGKTALVRKVLAGLPEDLAARCLYLSGIKDLQDLLRRLIRELYEIRNPNLRRQLHAEGVLATTFDVWLKALSSSRLRGTLYRAVEGNEYRIFLDHHPPLTRAVAKTIKELFWMRKTPVYLLSRDPTKAVLGRVACFLYRDDRERLLLGPLPAHAARKLLEASIRRFALSKLALEDFREEVLKLSGQVPGAIVKMCALAADPRYQHGSRIKTRLVHIDYLMSEQKPGQYRPRGAFLRTGGARDRGQRPDGGDHLVHRQTDPQQS